MAEPLRYRIRVRSAGDRSLGTTFAEAWETDPEIVEAFLRHARRLNDRNLTIGARVERADFSFHPDRPTPVWVPIVDAVA